MSDLGKGLLVLDLAGPQQAEDVLGPLGHGVLHPVVVPQLLDTQLHPTQVVVTWGGGGDGLGDAKREGGGGGGGGGGGKGVGVAQEKGSGGEGEGGGWNE